MTKPRKFNEIEGLVTMLLSACKDASMNETLRTVLSQNDDVRKQMVRELLERFHQAKAPKNLYEAFVALLDDEVAQRALQVIEDCK